MPAVNNTMLHTLKCSRNADFMLCSYHSNSNNKQEGERKLLEVTDEICGSDVVMVSRVHTCLTPSKLYKLNMYSFFFFLDFPGGLPGLP